MTNLPKSLRGRIKEEQVGWPVHVVSRHGSADGTTKLLVGTLDEERVETVLIPQLDDPRIVTQCISSQVGCAMGCVFCASGVAGLKRHMSDAEIIAQVLLGRRELGPERRLRNVVLMGMGEPLHNYDAVARALVLLTHPDGVDLSKRRVTVSTSGLVKQIDRLGQGFRRPGPARDFAPRGPRRRSKCAHARQSQTRPRAAHRCPAAISALETPAHHHRIHVDSGRQRLASRREGDGRAAPRHPCQDQLDSHEPNFGPLDLRAPASSHVTRFQETSSPGMAFRSSSARRAATTWRQRVDSLLSTASLAAARGPRPQRLPRA